MLLLSGRKDRTGVYEVSRQIVANSPQKDSLLWQNFAARAMSNFCLEETEEALLKSAECGQPNYNGSPYTALVALHVQQGEFTRAASEFKLIKSHRAGRDPSSLGEDQASVDRLAACFLLSLGRAADAEHFARRAYDCPSRLANNTSDPLSQELSHALLLWTVLQARLSQSEATDFLVDTTLAEREAARSAVAAECWRLRNEVLKILSDPDRGNPLLPYPQDEVGVESWLLGQFVQMLPTGIIQELLRQARQTDRHPAAGPYYDALEAERALIVGNPEMALEMAKKALQALPVKHEKLLRARTNAVAAEASRQLGNRPDWLRRMDEVLGDFPAALRLLNIAIPVRLEDDGDPLSRRLAAALADSKLLRRDDGGFALRVSRQGDSLVVKMASGNGETRLTVSAAADKGEDRQIEAALQQLAETLLSPWLNLTPVQINGLARVSRLR